MDAQWFKRQLIKQLLKPVLNWKPLSNPIDGFSIVLGVPWALRHLLEVNLRFIERTDLSGMDRLLIVFDRTHQPKAEDIIHNIRTAFPKLPLEFYFHPPLAGWIVRQVDQSKFYACLNWVCGIKHCRTRYVVLHDFDLYPVVPNFFTDIVGTMRKHGLRFSGAEYTHFDGLTDEDGLIGTWELGIDAEWLRRHFSPVDCFHSVSVVNGRRVDLDGFSEIQAKTPERRLAGSVGRNSYAHVTNLCSTHLRFSKGERVKVAWRLPYLWYLESLAGNASRLADISNKMQSANSPRIAVDERAVDFHGTHITCSNVLKNELTRMELALFGVCRRHVEEYVACFSEFLQRVGTGGELGTTKNATGSPDGEPHG